MAPTYVAPSVHIVERWLHELCDFHRPVGKITLKPNDVLDVINELNFLTGRLAYFTEAALATSEGLPAKTSKRERARFETIAEQMVSACRGRPLPASGTPRLWKLVGGE